jgi:hypothetical protein
MKVIALPKGGGKTTELIKLCYENNGIFVCAKEDEKRNILALSKRISCNLCKVITISDLLNLNNNYNYTIMPNDKFYFDNIDYILFTIIKRKLSVSMNIDAITININEEAK